MGTKFKTKYNELVDYFCDGNNYLQHRDCLTSMCQNSTVRLFNTNIIIEMNNDVFPIPKQLLSYYVKHVLDDGFWFVDSKSMKFVIEQTKQSENFNLLKIDMNKLQLTKNKSFLFVCLPYKKRFWLQQLKTYFTSDQIIDLFNQFNNQNGVSGTYHSGFIVIINSDILHCLKDIEEIVEHEFIHIFENINGEQNKEELSFELNQIIHNKNEYNTSIVNLLNRLDKLFDKYCIIHKLTGTKDDKQAFLKSVYNSCEKSNSPYILSDQIKNYYDDKSDLLINSIYFLWNLIHWQPKELQQIKQKIHNHFFVDDAN